MRRQYVRTVTLSLTVMPRTQFADLYRRRVGTDLAECRLERQGSYYGWLFDCSLAHPTYCIDATRLMDSSWRRRDECLAHVADRIVCDVDYAERHAPTMVYGHANDGRIGFDDCQIDVCVMGDQAIDCDSVSSTLNDMIDSVRLNRIVRA